MITLVPAEAEHVGVVAGAMRVIDRKECSAFGHEPAEALHSAIDRSLWSLTAMDQDGPIAILGIVPRSLITGHGVPWMLGTDAIYRNPRAVALLGKPVIAEMRSSFTKLENFVSVDNAKAISFLRHFGWTFSEEVYVIGGVEFVRFE